MTDVSPDIADALGPMQSLFACEHDGELSGIVVSFCYTYDVVVKDVNGRYGAIVGIVIGSVGAAASFLLMCLYCCGCVGLCVDRCKRRKAKKHTRKSKDGEQERFLTQDDRKFHSAV